MAAQQFELKKVKSRIFHLCSISSAHLFFFLVVSASSTGPSNPTRLPFLDPLLYPPCLPRSTFTPRIPRRRRVLAQFVSTYQAGVCDRRSEHGGAGSLEVGQVERRDGEVVDA